MPRERAPQRRERPQPGQHAQATRPEVAGHGEQRRSLRADVGALEGVVHPLRLCAESREPPRLVRSGEARDLVDGSRRIGVEIEALVGAPGVARQHPKWLNRQAIGQRRAGRLEDLVEDPPHREDGRTGIDIGLTRTHPAHLAARRRSLLDQRHRQPLAGQQQGAHQSGDAPTDDDHTMCAQGLSHKRDPTTNPARRRARNGRTSIQKSSRCAATP